VAGVVRGAAMRTEPLLHSCAAAQPARRRHRRLLGGEDGSFLPTRLCRDVLNHYDIARSSRPAADPSRIRPSALPSRTCHRGPDQDHRVAARSSRAEDVSHEAHAIRHLHGNVVIDSDVAGSLGTVDKNAINLR